MIMSHFFSRQRRPGRGKSTGPGISLGLVLLCVACAGVQPTPGPATDARGKVVNIAISQLGSPYKYDGYDRTGFDDNGLVHFSYAEAGYRLPLEADGQLRAGQPLRFAEARPGDILFYKLDKNSRENDDLHVGIFIGDGQMVHSSLRRDEVVSEVIDNPYWFQRLVAVIKVLP